MTTADTRTGRMTAIYRDDSRFCHVVVLIDMCDGCAWTAAARDPGGTITSGSMARGICEAIIVAYLMGKEAK